MTEFPAQPRPTAALHEWAVWCGEIGRLTGAFKVFPCWPGEKSPRWPGWQEAATWDRKTIEVTWANEPRCNIGLAIQPGFMAIDADLYKPGAADKLAAFEAQHGSLPPTLEFISARGGYHLIYASDKPLGNGTGTLPDFGDVRGHGGLLVGPGSIWEGQRYSVEAVEAPQRLPTRIEGMLREKRAAAQANRELPQFVMLDDPLNVDAFTKWLKHEAKPAIEGQGGNNTLAATGAMGSSFALSDDTTIQLMLEHWNDRCVPPWEPEQLERHGLSGYRTASSDFGNKAQRNPRLMFEPATGDAGWGPRVLTAGDFTETEPPARQWAAGDDNDGWLPLGELTTLYGPGGSGKTTLAGQWALAQARGEHLFNLIPMRRMPVLFIACEDKADELHRRFRKQGIRKTDDVRFASLVGLDTALHPAFQRGAAMAEPGSDTAFYQFVHYHLGRMGSGDKLLILDNLSQIYQGDYMDIPQVRAFLNIYCGRLLMKHNATGILLAHPSDNQKVTGDGSFGSMAWSAGVRSRLYFDYERDGKGKEDGDVRRLSKKKVNYSKKHGEGDGIRLDWQDWSFVPAAPRDKPALPPEHQEDDDVKAARKDKPRDREAKASIVRAELDRMFDGNRSRDWTTEKQVALSVGNRLGKAGQVGFGDSVLAKVYLPMIRNSGYRHYADGKWGYVAEN